ncbi:MAG: hypothetical protein ACRDV2_04445, partial [Actinomycetes bacterium]
MKGSSLDVHGFAPGDGVGDVLEQVGQVGFHHAPRRCAAVLPPRGARGQAELAVVPGAGPARR